MNEPTTSIALSEVELSTILAAMTCYYGVLNDEELTEDLLLPEIVEIATNRNQHGFMMPDDVRELIGRIIGVRIALTSDQP